MVLLLFCEGGHLKMNPINFWGKHEVLTQSQDTHARVARTHAHTTLSKHEVPLTQFVVDFLLFLSYAWLYLFFNNAI